MDGSSLVGYSPQGHKESDKTEQLTTRQVVLVVKNPSASAGHIRNVGLIPESRRSPGGGHGSLLQHSCWQNPMNEELGGLESTGPQRVRHE